MIIDRKTIHGLLDASRIAVSSNPIMNQAMIVAKDGRVSVTCTDGTLTMCNSSECNDTLSILVEAKRIKAFVGSAKGEDIKIEQGDNNVVLRSGRARAKFATMPIDDFPMPSPIKDDSHTVRVDGAILSESLSMVIHSAGKSDSRPFLNGVHFTSSGGVMSLQASNGSKGSIIGFDVDSDNEFSVIVPVRSATEIMKMNSGSMLLRIDSASIQVDTENTTLNTKLISAKYPNLAAIFPKTDTDIVMDRASLISALACVGVASEMATDKASHSYRRIVIEASGDVMRIRSQAKNGDEAEDSIDIDATDHEFSIALNPDLLSSALSSMSGQTLTIMHEREKKDAPIVISDGSDARHLIMPIRI